VVPVLGGCELRSYADSMAALAQQHWAADEGAAGCRIEWCVQTAREFFSGGERRAAEREALQLSKKRKAGEDGSSGTAPPPKRLAAAAAGAHAGAAPSPAAAGSEDAKSAHQRLGAWHLFSTSNIGPRAPLRLLDVGSCYDPFR
jgi:hypothetical protein